MHYQWDIIGHDKELSLLEKDLLQGNISHAYLFAGPSNIGKSTAGRKMAVFLQCGNDTENPVYNEILRGCHGDTIEFFDDNEAIKIEQVRALLERVHMSRQSKYKIIFIENIERMTGESGNALLKTLEDPPENVVFILTSSRVRDVLPTIISRVRLVQFSLVKDSDIEKLLDMISPDLDAETKKSIVEFSMGCPGKAVSFLKEESLLKSYEKFFSDASNLLRSGNRSRQFSFVEQIIKDAKEGHDNGIVKDFLGVMLLSARKEMLYAVMQNDTERLNRLVNFFARAHEASEMLRRNVNGRLLLENLILSI
jgi:DNA polymerase III delta prime subunit